MKSNNLKRCNFYNIFNSTNTLNFFVKVAKVSFSSVNELGSKQKKQKYKESFFPVVMTSSDETFTWYVSQNIVDILKKTLKKIITQKHNPF